MATQPSMPSASEIISRYRQNQNFLQQFNDEATRIFGEMVDESQITKQATDQMKEAFGRKWRDRPESDQELMEREERLRQTYVNQARTQAEQSMEEQGIGPEWAGGYVSLSEIANQQAGLQTMLEEVAPIAALESLGLDTAADQRRTQAEQDVQRFEPSLPARDRARATELAGMTEGEFTDSLDERATAGRQRQQFERLQQAEAEADRMYRVGEAAMEAQSSPAAMEAFIQRIESDPDQTRKAQTAAMVAQMDGFEGFNRPIEILNPDGTVGTVDFNVERDPLEAEMVEGGDMDLGTTFESPRRGSVRRWSLDEVGNELEGVRNQIRQAKVALGGVASVSDEEELDVSQPQTVDTGERRRTGIPAAVGLFAAGTGAVGGAIGSAVDWTADLDPGTTAGYNPLRRVGRALGSGSPAWTGESADKIPSTPEQLDEAQFERTRNAIQRGDLVPGQEYDEATQRRMDEALQRMNAPSDKGNIFTNRPRMRWGA